MVAVISSGPSILRMLNYNENKVKKGVANCFSAFNFPLDPERMSFQTKLNFLRRQMELNPNVKHNSVHISLNFHPSESALSSEKLQQIAEQYLKLLGFADQPCLVYQHHDAGHPHLHLVTTNIRKDGSRISLHNIGRLKSEPARKEIEKRFELVPAEEQQKGEIPQLKPISIRVDYGKTDTKRAIQNVLLNVLTAYKFSSLPELNAILGLYNIQASRGEEKSKVFNTGGLLYRVLDENGRPVGVPIKASSLHNKPTLKALEEKFTRNRLKKDKHKTSVSSKLDDVMSRHSGSLEEFIRQLKAKAVDVVLRQNEEGRIYGITYIDHQCKCVFNGSALGKKYSAKSLTDRFESTPSQTLLTRSAKSHDKVQPRSKPAAAAPHDSQFEKGNGFQIPGLNLFADLIQTDQTDDTIPYELRQKKKRKKRRRNISNNN